MGPRPLYILSLFEYGDRPYTSDPDVYRIRQNLTSTDVRFWRIKMVPALTRLKVNFRLVKRHLFHQDVVSRLVHCSTSARHRASDVLSFLGFQERSSDRDRESADVTCLSGLMMIKWEIWERAHKQFTRHSGGLLPTRYRAIVFAAGRARIMQQVMSDPKWILPGADRRTEFTSVLSCPRSGYLTNSCLMSGHRRRRWPNIKPPLV